MILPLDRPLIALDLETHDMGKPESLRIVELSFIIVDPDPSKPHIEWSKLINPCTPIARSATGVHHISDAMVQDPSVPRFSQIAARLARGFTQCDFCGYHVLFDLRVLRAEFKRAGHQWSYKNARLLDGSALWRTAVPRTLSDAVRTFLHREPRQAHRASGDARDALDVALAQLELWSDKFAPNLQTIHDLCGFDLDNEIDPDRKFVFNDEGEVICNFGAHRDKPLKVLPKQYLQWIATKAKDFSPEVKQLAKDAIEGKYPVKS